MYKFFKRLFDVVSSAFALIVLSPIILLTILGIIISDFGNPFYVAKRVGIDNKEFSMFKFRSMRVDRSANEKSLRADVNRIFAFGSFIRATKIDELPQLINVFIGDMAVIGPRPASIDQVEITRSGKNKDVAKIKPGLSSPSALYDFIYGDTIQDEKEYEEKVLPKRLALDVYYANNFSAGLDLKIIWLTMVCVICSLLKITPNKILKKMEDLVD